VVAPAQIITLVTGLPRSGTSLLMQMLAAAGVPPYSDGERAADASNPRGYFEHARVAGLARETDFSWLLQARGRALKVVAPLLAFLPREVEGEPLYYRVVFMERPMPEVIASQAAMLQRLGRAGAVADVARAYRQQVLSAHGWMRGLGAAGQLAATALSYPDLVAAPGAHCARAAGFIGRPQAAAAMAQAVDGSLYRTRKDAPPTAAEDLAPRGA
jgi:hypothetical protein